VTPGLRQLEKQEPPKRLLSVQRKIVISVATAIMTAAMSIFTVTITVRRFMIETPGIRPDFSPKMDWGNEPRDSGISWS
jgi:hypothetical protein